ncbi:hypothetical protein TRAPUB_3465 [Trametes pubescens]|uniref:Uncharacterized protein n=1 Tax=Trametes pubescens TaxID=154538 RepID=A0A1M2VDQ2_TRAPU|nr:hypothetical protein TRAPUB_3465 [Trametes pubescens]
MPSKTTLSPPPRYPDIVLALDLMSTTPPRFHWFFFIPDMPAAASSSAQRHGGVKLHAITNGKQGDDRRWSYDRTPLALATSPAVAAAALLGRLPDGKSVDDLDALLRQIPMEVPEVDREREPTWSCRVWIREALRRMHVSGYIHCEDVDAMEAEMWRYGKEAAAKIEDDTFEVASLVEALHSRALA